MDEILEIADDSSNDWIDREGADGKKYRFLGPVGDCRHKDYGRLTMSPLVLSTMANNSLCSASGTLNFAIVSSKSLQKAAHVGRQHLSDRMQHRTLDHDTSSLIGGREPLEVYRPKIPAEVLLHPGPNGQSEQRLRTFV